MDTNYISIVLVALGAFVFGGLWYSPLMFGKTWMNIMGGCDKYTEEEMKKIQKEMGKFYILQAFLTFITMYVLYQLIHWILSGVPRLESFYPDGSEVGASDITSKGVWIAFFMWLGFVMPTQISGVIWGNTDKKWWWKQVSIMAICQLIIMLVAGYVFSIY